MIDTDFSIFINIFPYDQIVRFINKNNYSNRTKESLGINNDQIYNSIVIRHVFLIILFITIPFLIKRFGNCLIPLILDSWDILFHEY